MVYFSLTAKLEWLTLVRPTATARAHSRSRNAFGEKTLTSCLTRVGGPEIVVGDFTDLMGGAITIESEQGKGTTVHITTVHRMAPTFDGTESANTLKKMTKSLKGVRILLAEDNPLNAEIAIEVLRGAGVEVDTVGDGEDCVKAVTEKSAGYYAAVLMDIQMPRMDEYAATKLIRAFADLRKKRIPVIAMTANAFAEDQQKAMACGMDAFLARPLNLMLILKTLDAVIEKTAQTA